MTDEFEKIIRNPSQRVRSALSEQRAKAIVSPTSSELQDIHIVFADGRVRIFAGSQTRRTEIEVGKFLVVVHKNPDGYSGVGRFNRIEVLEEGSLLDALEIAWDQKSSYTNPLYVVRKLNGEMVGYGDGQHLDRCVASHFYPGEVNGTGANSISAEVLDWLDAHVGRGFV